MHPEQHPCRLEPRPRQALAATLLFRKYCLSVCNDTPVSRPYSLLQTRRSACPSSPPNLRVFHNTGYARRYHRALTFTPSSTPFASPDCVHLHGRLHSPPKKGLSSLAWLRKRRSSMPSLHLHQGYANGQPEPKGHLLNTASGTGTARYQSHSPCKLSDQVAVKTRTDLATTKPNLSISVVTL